MTDRELQEQVQKALDWEPSVEAAGIGVSVDDGVVTLRGDARNYAEKLAAERVALHVFGVRAVANELNVNLGAGQTRTDSDIAQAVVSALEWNALVPKGAVTVAVSKGWVSLQGQVDWDYQRVAAVKTVRNLTGVRGVTNAITVQPRVNAVDVKSKIEAALKRSAELDARQISVTVTDSKVLLSGNVHTWFERTEAERAAWSAPGVKEVDDQILVVA
jgi:osmotically-inducible protein OsmY